MLYPPSHGPALHRSHSLVVSRDVGGSGQGLEMQRERGTGGGVRPSEGVGNDFVGAFSLDGASASARFVVRVHTDTCVRAHVPRVQVCTYARTSEYAYV